MSDTILAVRDLVKEYHRNKRTPVTALRGVSFDVTRGRALGVIGESGSGKTTLARIVLGLDAPTSGSVEIAGQPVDLSGNPRRRRHLAGKVQVVFQDPYSSLDPLQTVGAMLSEVFRQHHGRRAKDSDLVMAVRDVGLPETVIQQRPAGLSGGQRQRVAIARALVPQPELLVLDEAVSALDVSVQAQILNLINRIRLERELSLVFITHDLGVVRQTCDDVVVMLKGEIVDHGTVTEVLDVPRTPYTRALRAAVPEPGWDVEQAARLVDMVASNGSAPDA